jgi:hypothetical protein
MVRGIFPSNLQDRPNLNAIYHPVIKAIRNRNLGQLQKSLESPVLRRNFFFLLSKLELLVHRLILKDIVNISGERKVSFTMYGEIMSAMGSVVSSVAEIFAILIQDGLVNGYISYEENVLMLTGSTPFPIGPFQCW